MAGPDRYRAWPLGADPAEVARANSRARELLLDGGGPDTGALLLRELVAESWRRCLSQGLGPGGPAPAVDLLDGDLDAYRQDHPLATVMPAIRRLLVEDATDSGLLVAVTDAAGRLLWVEGSHHLRSRAEGMHFVEGALWDEATAGTNAPGTALAVDHPLQIFGAEHLAEPVTAWSCSAAPIHGPDGRLLGALDVTGGDEAAAPHTLRLVTVAAAAIEAELRLAALTAPPARSTSGAAADRTDGAGAGATSGTPRRRSRLVTPRPTPATPAVLRVLGRSHAELELTGSGRRLLLRQRHGELLLVLAAHPHGLTSDQLDLALHPEPGAGVTARAEVSRLRTILTEAGGPEVGSRPYRVEPEPVTDAGTVRRLLAAGSLRAALEAYTGPVLPLSEAPEVVRLRADLEQSVRHAVLADADPELVWDLASRPENALDLALWQACAELQPARSPRHREATAVVRRLDLELG